MALNDLIKMRLQCGLKSDGIQPFMENNLHKVGFITFLELSSCYATEVKTKLWF